MTRLMKIIIMLSMIYFLASDASLGQTLWQVGTGNWNTPTNWTLGVPNAASGSAFDAQITNGGTAQLLDPGGTVRRMRIGVAAAGHLQIHGGGLAVTEDLLVNVGAAGVSSVSVTGGSTVTAPITTVGYSSAANSSFLIADAGTTYYSPAAFTVGQSGGGAVATLNIQSGGLLISGDGQMGNFNTATTGNVTITDPDSRWWVGSNHIINRGALTILNEGTMFVGSDLAIGNLGSVHLNGGTLRFNTLSSGLALLQFTTGTIQLAGDRTIGSDTVITSKFGASPVIPSGKGLTVEGTATLPATTPVTLSGGTLTAGTLLMSPGSRITTTQASIAAGAVIMPAGAIVNATGGDLILGDVNKLNGFYSNGTLQVGQRTVMLADSNDAVLDSGALVTLGAGGVPGALAAANGLTLDFGGNITGFGAVNTPNSAAKPLINNGHIAGASSIEPITLAGYVKGVGTLDNVNVTGTLAPGFSPATVTLGSVAYAGQLEIELGGTALGNFDRLEHTIGAGAAQLGGSLTLSLINGFIPSLGDTFEFLTAAGGVNGTFAAETLPSLAGGLGWDVIYGANSVVLEVTAAPSFTADFDDDGDVDLTDLGIWKGAFNLSQLGDADGDNDSDGNDFLLWQRQLGSVPPAVAASANVPEPSNAALAAAVGLFLTALARRRRELGINCV
jgi:hypothetical protein